MSFEMAKGKLEAPIKITSNYLGYKEWLFPYEAEVVFNAEINADIDNSQVKLVYASGQVGEGTHARFNEFFYDMEESRGQGFLNIESDLRLVKEMGFLKEILGSFDSRVDWSLEDEVLEVDWSRRPSG